MSKIYHFVIYIACWGLIFKKTSKKINFINCIILNYSIEIKTQLNDSKLRLYTSSIDLFLFHFFERSDNKITHGLFGRLNSGIQRPTCTKLCAYPVHSLASFCLIKHFVTEKLQENSVNLAIFKIHNFREKDHR